MSIIRRAFSSLAMDASGPFGLDRPCRRGERFLLGLAGRDEGGGACGEQPCGLGAGRDRCRWRRVFRARGGRRCSFWFGRDCGPRMSAASAAAGSSGYCSRIDCAVAMAAAESLERSSMRSLDQAMRGIAGIGGFFADPRRGFPTGRVANERSGCGTGECGFRGGEAGFGARG